MFGDFLHEEKQYLLDIDNIYDLENGTVIVAEYNQFEYQFGIYGKRHVIYQDAGRLKTTFSFSVLKNVPSKTFSKRRMYMNTFRTSIMTRQKHSILPIANMVKCVTNAALLLASLEVYMEMISP